MPNCRGKGASVEDPYPSAKRNCSTETFRCGDLLYGGGRISTQHGRTRKAARKALEYGIRIVGIKLGDRGSFIMNKDGDRIQAPAFKVEVVDTTGAGDGWNAGLIIGLCKGWDLKKCITVVNVIGALIVTKRGAITAMPYEEELIEFLKRVL